MRMHSGDELWEAYFADFKRVFTANDLESAVRILYAAYGDCEEYSEIDFRLVGATHSMASAFCRAGSFEQATELYRKFVELREKVLGPNHPDVAESLEKVALLQLVTKDSPTARLNRVKKPMVPWRLSTEHA